MATGKKTVAKKPILTREWLEQSPPDDEITMIGDVKCLLNLKVEEKLDRLTGYNWSTSDYKSKYLQDEDGNMCISASLLLEVTYGRYLGDTQFIHPVTRRLVGAVSYPLAYFPQNVHYDNTAKTLCIGNAASELGRQFGRGLNGDQQPVVISGGNGVDNYRTNGNKNKKRSPVKMQPDMAIMNQYSEALMNNDADTKERLESMYDFSPHLTQT